ncbi:MULTISPECIES: hypothetical protein [Cupriavidus]|uniref:hypothetical protein n=1 Tax=Cupriavidus pauculus TaxID=82633 RepID=UPI001C93467A|nr:hypothetical protein [Cupriavidus pauculus]MBY4731758.1 hypothetical protein [Cupriavidus pauculus]
MSTYIALNRRLPDLVEYKVTKRAHGVDYKSTVLLEARQLGITASRTWIAVALLALKEKNESQGELQATDLGFFRTIVHSLCAEQEVKSKICSQIATIGRREVVALFRDMERVVSRFTWAEATKARGSMYFRRVMVEAVPATLFIEDVHDHSRYFKTALTGKYNPRPTLSHFPTTSNRRADPIDAIPHEDIRDLREKAVQIMEADIGVIKAACEYDLKYWASVREKLRYHAKHSISDCVYEEILDFINNRRVHQRNLIRPENYPVEVLLGAFGRFEADARVNRLMLGNCFDAEVRNSILEMLNISVEEMQGVQFHNIAGLCIHVHARELVAAFYALLCHSKWNSDSLRSLLRDNIEEYERSYRIRGFKNKTDEYAPPVLIEVGDSSAWIAVNLLIWNHEQLKSRRLIGENEQRMWFAWTNKKGLPMTSCYTAHAGPKKKFLLRHGIPWFSDEQIRNHNLTLKALRKRDGIFDAQVEAGHASLSTTEHYADQFITQLLISSVNLEFQRRLDSTQKIALWGEQSDFVKRLRFQKFDTRLALPVGDGSSCVDAANPPDLAWLAGGVCDGKRCHVGGGCANNRISVTKPRVEELWRFAGYYKRNWRRLLAENEDAFREFHAPAMLFALTFINFLKNSQYWNEVKEYIPAEDLK